MQKTGGILQFRTPGHSILSTTHPDLYNYFNCSMQKTTTGMFIVTLNILNVSH